MCVDCLLASFISCNYFLNTLLTQRNYLLTTVHMRSGWYFFYLIMNVRVGEVFSQWYLNECKSELFDEESMY